MPPHRSNMRLLRRLKTAAPLAHHTVTGVLSTCVLLLPLAVAIATGAAVSSAPSTFRPQVDQPAPMFNYADPHFLPNRTGIVELFEWKFADVAAECEHFLGPNGYAGVQLSPVTEHLVVRTEEVRRPWWERYHPISYRIATRSGDEADFLQMSRACNAAGVRVYVDVVLNHMAKAYDDATAAGAELLVGTAGSTANASSYDYPAVPYTRADFHEPCAVENYMDAYEVRNCQLDGRPDLDHSWLRVQTVLVDLLDHLVDLGVAGFHLDAAKYIWPIDIKLTFRAVKDLNSEDFDFPEGALPFVYQDVLDLGVDSVSKTEYSSYGVVTEYLYAAELSTIISGKVALSSLINWGPAMGFLSHQDALVFVDSHEGQRGLDTLGSNRLLTYRQRHKYIMANAFMLAHPFGGVKRIMSSYHFPADSVNQGPPVAADAADDNEIIRSPEYDEQAQCTVASGWVCEHRWPAIVNMVALANVLYDAEDGVINFQTDGPNHIAFCRGHKAFIAMNNDAQLPYATEVQTCLAPGVYCDVISGGRDADGERCRGKRIVVDAEGRADIMLPAIVADGSDSGNESEVNGATDDEFGVLAIYVGSKLNGDGDEVEEAEVAEMAIGDEAPQVEDTTDADDISLEGLEKSAKMEEGAENAEEEVQEAEAEAVEESEAVNGGGEEAQLTEDNAVEGGEDEAVNNDEAEVPEAEEHAAEGGDDAAVNDEEAEEQDAEDNASEGGNVEEDQADAVEEGEVANEEGEEVQETEDNAVKGGEDEVVNDEEAEAQQTEDNAAEDADAEGEAEEQPAEAVEAREVANEEESDVAEDGGEESKAETAEEAAAEDTASDDDTQEAKMADAPNVEGEADDENVGEVGEEDAAAAEADAEAEAKEDAEHDSQPDPAELIEEVVDEVVTEIVEQLEALEGTQSVAEEVADTATEVADAIDATRVTTVSVPEIGQTIEKAIASVKNITLRAGLGGNAAGRGKSSYTLTACLITTIIGLYGTA